MSNRKHATAIQGLSRRSRRLYRKLSKRLVNGLLRSVLLFQRRGRLSTSGFILPTTVLLILVVALTVGALTFRAATRNQQVIGQAEQRVIYNAATPAIDRARSKLEFMFDGQRDTRLPGGVPGQNILEAMLLNNGFDREGRTFPRLTVANPAGGDPVDPYTLPDEQRLDLNGDGRTDNAWWFRTDTNSDGRVDAADSTIVYSIIPAAPTDTRNLPPNTPRKTIGTLLLEMSDSEKASKQFVRQGPLSIDNALGCRTNSPTNAKSLEGWFEDTKTTAILRKNFQVDALVIPGTENATKVTLEFTQDRQLDRGNKWGAWFRNDLEIYPGPQFNWNGAMHSEGSLIVGGNSFNAYLISSPASCLYYPDASEISVTEMSPDAEHPNRDYLGLVSSGVVKDGNQSGSSRFHLHHPTNPGAAQNVKVLDSTTSSSRATNPINISLDPERVLLDPQNGYTNRSQTNNETDGNLRPEKRQLPDFGTDTNNNKLPQRIRNSPQPMPYVDDLYRADDRWGPKGSYDNTTEGRPTPGDENEEMGDKIPAGNTKLLRLDPGEGDEEASNVGLDGYWERRARAVGLRILVGQRLELGNLFTWYAPQDKNDDGFVNSTAVGGVVDQVQYEHEGDPLYPPNIAPYPVAPNTGRLSHIDLHRRTLRDNLSAVQSTAIYHHAAANSPEEKDYPIACLATTAHPGTLTTLRQSILFRPVKFWGTDDTIDSSLLSNFFTGVGTNGWEYEPPAGNFANFKTTITNPSSPLRIALQNLANFAGDHQNGVSGAYPPTQDGSNGVIHPYPALSMWGNFSNLKRALADLDANGYDALSVADKTYLQTAACTVGMLAHNIDQIQRFDPSNPKNDRKLVSNSQQTLMAKLARDLWKLMDGSLNPANNDLEVLPREQLGTYLYGQAPAGAQPAYELYNVRDYDKVPPEAFIAALRQLLLAQGWSPDSRDFIEEMRLAETIMLHFQIRRDRSFGFKPSPAFGFYDFSVSPTDLSPATFRRISTACDPDEFAFSGDDLQLKGIYAPDLNRIRTPSTTAANQPEDADNLAYLPDSNNPTKQKPELARYRVALSRLCGTIDYALVPQSGQTMPLNLANPLSISDSKLNDMEVTPVVLPKFPALYYLFPEVEHGVTGDNVLYDHRQPDRNNPYILLGRSPLKNPNVASATFDPTTAGGAVCSLQNLGTPANTNQSCSPAPTVTVIREPYVTDAYVRNINARFRPVSNTVAQGRSGVPSLPPNAWPSTPPETAPLNPALSGKPSRRPVNQVFPIADYQVSQVALQPRNPEDLNSLKLPVLGTPRPFSQTGNERANFSTNLILVPDADRLKAIAVPFLDRGVFDGRQLMLTRTLDIDLGMLRSNSIAEKDIWLPLSGIVYAFREDAVREDGIARPVGTQMDLRNPARQTDPIRRRLNAQGLPEDAGSSAQPLSGISAKPIDPFPDPDRRIYGFRLRNGVQLMRNRVFEGRIMDSIRNFRGLSFFTDQPVYIQGDFNLHQDGPDDTIGNLLEEFNEKLPENTLYNTTQFYNNRRNPNPNFANPESNNNADRWRPTEILADSITILSNNFCDGTIADAFVQMNTSLASYNYRSPGSARYPAPDFAILDVNNPSASRGYYHRPEHGLFSPGCATAQITSFHNQNRPDENLPNTGQRSGWDWVRENFRYDVTVPQRNSGYVVDFAAPVRISRTGHPLVARPRDPLADPLASAPLLNEQRTRVLPPVSYATQFGGTNPARAYFNYGDNGSGSGLSGANRIINATPTRVNSIIVSGINPSRPNQGYGGLHNFPRFLENWGNQRLHFAGSLLQLSYSNYATSPFELENLEPGATEPAVTNENIRYYSPPIRLWGYDVGLQFSPAAPAASRFVTAGKNRNEFYVELPVDDPYISNLCKAAVRSVPGLRTNCPERN